VTGPLKYTERARISIYTQIKGLRVCLERFLVSTVLLRVVAVRSNPSSRRGGGPIPKHINVLVRTKIWSSVPTEPETKNDFAGEVGQQVTVLLCRASFGRSQDGRFSYLKRRETACKQNLVQSEIEESSSVNGQCLSFSPGEPG
jgi:hypothetical protein